MIAGQDNRNDGLSRGQMNKYYLVTVTGSESKLAFEAPDDGVERSSLIADAIFETGIRPSSSAAFTISPLDTPTEKQLSVTPEFSRDECRGWVIGGRSAQVV